MQNIFFILQSNSLLPLQWLKSQIICYLSQQLVIMWFIVRNKWEHWRTSTGSDRLSRKHLFNISALSFITSQGHQFMSHQRQMRNQSKLRIQNNTFSVVRVLGDWNVAVEVARGASEGHQQRNNYANSPPLCLTSNNTALYICKDWQDAACTHALLSARSHAGAVTPKWVTSVSDEAAGQRRRTSFPQGAHANAGKKRSICGTHHISGVKWRGALRSPSVPRKLGTLNNLISGGFIIPAEVKSTWLALRIYSAVGLFGHH